MRSWRLDLLRGCRKGRRRRGRGRHRIEIKIAPGVTAQFVANTVSPFAEAEKAPAKELKEAKAVSDKK